MIPTWVASLPPYPQPGDTVDSVLKWDRALTASEQSALRAEWEGRPTHRPMILPPVEVTLSRSLLREHTYAQWAAVSRRAATEHPGLVQVATVEVVAKLDAYLTVNHLRQAGDFDLSTPRQCGAGMGQRNEDNVLILAEVRAWGVRPKIKPTGRWARWRAWWHEALHA